MAGARDAPTRTRAKFAAVRERPRWLPGVTGSPGGWLISVRESGVEVHVIPAGEEAMIGRHTIETIA